MRGFERDLPRLVVNRKMSWKDLLLRKRRVLLQAAGLLVCLYGALHLLHMSTYVWQSTSLSSYMGSWSRSSCQLAPGWESNSGSWPGGHPGAVKIGMVMLHSQQSPTANPNANIEWGEGLMEDVLRNHLQYAKRHGYHPIIANNLVDSSRPSAWSKLLAIKEHLPYYDYLIYLDMDTVIMNGDIRLESFIAAGGPCADIIMSEDWNGPNTGIWLIKNSRWSQWFVRHAWEMGEIMVQKKSPAGTNYPFEYEQRVFHYLLESKMWLGRELPRYPGGNSATPVEENHRAVKEMRKHVSVLPQCAFNSYCLHPLDSRGLEGDVSRYIPGDFLIHFAGKKGAIKAGLVRHYLLIAKVE